MTGNVLTKMQERNILQVHQDAELHTRLQEDLLAIEAEYHRPCYLAYLRSTDGATSGPTSHAAVVQQFYSTVDELLLVRKALRLKDLTALLNDMLEKNHQLIGDEQSEAPTIYQSQRLKAQLMAHYSDRVVFHKPKQRNQSELMYSNSITLADVLKHIQLPHENIDSMPNEPTYQETQSEEYYLTHAARIIQSAIKSMPTMVDNLGDITWQNSQAIVPQQLHTFLQLIADSSSSATQVCSVAQDLISLCSKSRTPKAIGLAVLVKTWTNNAKLIEHIHSLGHCISYRDTLAFDNNIAERILTKAGQSGMIIPDSIISRNDGGGFIQAAADNIDFIEETIDGSGTTHATSAVLYQHGSGERHLPIARVSN